MFRHLGREAEEDELPLLLGTAQGVTLQVSGYMPAHNHGLIQLPLVEEQGEGRYLVEGLLLHMRGDWQLRFQVLAGRDTESFTFELEL